MLLIGLAGVTGAQLAGGFILRFLYRPEFAGYQPLLVAAMGAGALGYLAISLGYSVTSARIFHAQLPLFAISTAACGLAAYLLVPLFGLYGAVLALACSALAQIIGQCLILAFALRRAEAGL